MIQLVDFLANLEEITWVMKGSFVFLYSLKEMGVYSEYLALDDNKKASLHPLALKYYGLCQKVSLPNGSSD
jgi:hypothetical protein